MWATHGSLSHIPPPPQPFKNVKNIFRPARAGQEPRFSQPLTYTAGQQNGKLSVTPLGWIWKGSKEAAAAVFWGPEWAESWLDCEVAGEQDGLTESSRVTVRPASQSLLSCYLCGFDQVTPCASGNFCELSPWEMNRKATYCEEKDEIILGCFGNWQASHRTLIQLVKAKTVSWTWRVQIWNVTLFS